MRARVHMHTPAHLHTPTYTHRSVFLRVARGENACKCVQVCANVCRCVRVGASVCEWVQACAGAWVWARARATHTHTHTHTHCNNGNWIEGGSTNERKRGLEGGWSEILRRIRISNFEGRTTRKSITRIPTVV